MLRSRWRARAPDKPSGAPGGTTPPVKSALADAGSECSSGRSGVSGAEGMASLLTLYCGIGLGDIAKAALWAVGVGDDRRGVRRLIGE